jgi:hypothetical protein
MWPANSAAPYGHRMTSGAPWFTMACFHTLDFGVIVLTSLLQ